MSPKDPDISEIEELDLKWSISQLIRDRKAEIKRGGLLSERIRCGKTGDISLRSLVSESADDSAISVPDDDERGQCD